MLGFSTLRCENVIYLFITMIYLRGHHVHIFVDLGTTFGLVIVALIYTTCAIAKTLIPFFSNSRNFHLLCSDTHGFKKMIKFGYKFSCSERL